MMVRFVSDVSIYPDFVNLLFQSERGRIYEAFENWRRIVNLCDFSGI